MRALLAFALACLLPLTAAAQAQPVTGKLLVTLVDETNGVLPGATITVTGIDPSNKSVTVQPAVTDTKGQATFENLPLGRYAVKGEFTGFQTRTLPEVRVRAGENRQVLLLPIDRVTSDVTVSRDKQAAAADRDVTFGTVMTREQIEALSDDPEELKRQLMDLAGPNAKILIDSFEGRELPPKALIKSIRITRDQFAPEVHYAGELRIEIITQPGIGPVRGSVRSSFYDSALDGNNPLVGQRGPARSYSYGASLNGTLISERASFNLSVNGSDSYSTPVQFASTPGGPVRGVLNVRLPSENYFVSGGMDYAVTKNHVLRMNFNGSNFSNRGGIGGREFAERAYDNSSKNFGLYLQQNGPIGRRMVLNTRLSISGNESRIQSALEAPAIIVNEEFSSGGAQRRGSTNGRNYWLNADLDYVRGLHSFRMGVELQHQRYRSDSQSNYLGTYVFESLEAYEAGRPRSYTRRIGDPNVRYVNTQGGIYIQDDFKVRKNFTLTGGVRYEAQELVDDVNNFAPRIGFTWAPTKSGKTTLRGSWGVFYDWLSTGTYAQTLQLDGFRQREVSIINPTYPDPGDAVAPPVSRYLLADDLGMAYSQRLSAGIAQTISRRVSTNVLYSYAYRYQLLAGRNLNAPVNGVRPDPTFANVVLASPDARGTEHYLNVSLNLNLAPMAAAGGPGAGAMRAGGEAIMMHGPGMVMVMGGPGAAPAGSSAPLFQWRRGLSVGTFYNYGRNLENTSGAFSVPASANLDDEWGPSAFDRRHNLHASITSNALRNLSARFSFSGSSAPPLNVLSGLDDNGDLVFNDRPDGYGRNSERTRPTYSSHANFTYSFTLGKKTVTQGGGVQIMGSPAGLTVGSAAATQAPRYRLNVSLNINNVFNQAFYSGFNGILNSPNFLQPSSASGWRRITFNTSMSF